MKRKLIVPIIITLVVSACASNKNKPNSQSREPITSLLPGGALLIGFNRNNDYVIDKTEFANGRVKAFEVADRNGNGEISITEFRSWQPKATGSITALPNLVHFDRNFNDRISQAEFYTGMEKLFNDADQNRDNEVSYEELIAIVAPPQASKRKANGGGRGGGRGRGDGSGRGQRGGDGSRPTGF